MATKLSSINTKFQVGAAAVAVAGAAALMQGAVANAAPAAPMPLAGLGSSLGECDEIDTGECENPLANASAGASASASAQPALCNALVCVGKGLSEADNILVVEWNMIPLLPEAIQPLFYGFWESVIPEGQTGCILGLMSKIDSYSTVTMGLARGCSG
ncbi:MAG: hypothetical protein K0U84_10360 [Actinomycetia bacterium]|nr:hypothetical protein [Actinomycetes bacterium]